jgi:hypothetical protein
VIIAMATAVLAVAPLTAGDDHGHRQHGTHEHGVASLNLAIEGPVIELELDSPAMNLVGFEHAPKSDAERETLDQTLDLLADGMRLFQWPAEAGCRLEDARVQSPLMPESAASPTPDSDHDHDHGPAGGVHADIRATYRFQCADPAEVTRVGVLLFGRFPGTERLRVQYVAPAGQGAVDLTPADPVLRF